jgi:hypothetical protein
MNSKTRIGNNTVRIIAGLTIVPILVLIAVTVTAPESAKAG